MRVVHCDNHVLVVDKPAGLLTVPDATGDESLLDLAREWVRAEFNKPGKAFLAVVHRLDRPVSGLVVFGRTSKGASRLSDAFRRKAVRKVYWGLVPSEPQELEGQVDQWLLKDPVRVRAVAVEPGTPGAKQALTEYRVLKTLRERVLLELVPLTGRSHQLRRAVTSIGCGGLLGDLKYGAERPLPDRSIALHAHELEFDHPTLDERMRFTAPPPEREWWVGASS